MFKAASITGKKSMISISHNKTETTNLNMFQVISSYILRHDAGGLNGAVSWGAFSRISFPLEEICCKHASASLP